MKRFFPKIEYVHTMPISGGIDTNITAYGLFNFDDNKIWVRKGKGSWRTLFHELCHWFVNKVLRCDGYDGRSKYHVWIDNHVDPHGKHRDPLIGTAGFTLCDLYMDWDKK